MKHSFWALVAAACLLTGQPAAAQGLPPGAGKDLLDSRCNACHSAESMVTSFGRSEPEWQTLVGDMIDRGAEISDDEFKVLVEYLTTHFGLKPAAPAPATPTGGSTAVTIREWDVPTANAFPHDPLAAADGSVWYTGQNANLLGRLDPTTGQIKEFPLKTAGSGPHGLAEDASGNIWYTGNAKGLIGKLDPKTGQVTEYPMPIPAARDPHTPVFDQKGTLWFTVQGANMVGRLNPATGELSLRDSPTLQSAPYGMVVSSTGVPFYVEFGTNKVASIDPSTMAIREWTLPNAAARPRRVAIDANDVIWYTDYARGYIGRLDPATSEVKEWASPAGPRSQPYGIAVIAGKVWYSESGVQPNTVVVFDPATERFQTWPIPSGGGVVRNVSVTRDGNLALALSGVNKIGLVEIKK